ncbi:MAG TPA: formyltransferase family protein [Candidatus Saccharimonadales bacterium]|nr:formyltransferase family protein [Candidatus Saccharimonadales bacterium]
MATNSAYLDAVRHDLWAREVFTFIPDRDLAPPPETITAGAGPRVAFAGFPSDFSLAFLLRLLQLDVEPVGIITSPGAHPAILGDNALSRVADHLGIPLIRAWRINDEHSRFAIDELGLDAVVMASFDQIVGPRALGLARHGWLNVHPSLLPAYRGPEPVYWAIADGAPVTGISMHRAAPKVDAGPILAQAPLAIESTDTAGTLTRKLVEIGMDLLPQALDGLLSDSQGLPVNMATSSYRSSVGHRSLEEAASAEEAERMVRAGVPNMLPWVRFNGHSVYVSASAVVNPGAGTDGTPVIHFEGADLELLRTMETCGCHHNMNDCEHRRSRTVTAR